MEKYLNQINMLLECYYKDRCAMFNHMNCDLNELELIKGRIEDGAQTEKDIEQLDILLDSMKCHCADCKRYKQCMEA